MKKRGRITGKVVSHSPVNLILYAILLLSAVFLVFNMLKYNILEFKKLNIIVFEVLILFITIVTYGLFKKKRSKLLTTFIIFALLITGSANYSIFKLSQAVNKLNDGAKTETYTIGVYVKSDSPITELNQLETTSLQAPVSFDEESINALISDIQTKENLDFGIEEVDSYAAAYENLLAQETEAIVINSKYLGLIEVIDAEFEGKIKSIYEFKQTHEVVETSDKKTSSDGSVFNVYISGVDAYGEISSIARSDVNIVMSVNTNTKEILLTTTPRDSYIAIAGGGNNQYDKLTHAGLYGVDASVGTLENLYGINIDYHTKINFTTFLKLIDLVGGIEVYNDQAFSAHTEGGEYYPPGNIKLDSRKALAFVRERYSLQGGDNDRGKNQQKVITAIIQKLSQPSNLVKIRDIMKELENSMQTNIPFETVMDLANKQLDSGKGYTINNQALVTHGTMGLPSYAMPGYNLYMAQVDQASLETSKQAIQKVLTKK